MMRRGCAPQNEMRGVLWIRQSILLSEEATKTAALNDRWPVGNEVSPQGFDILYYLREYVRLGIRGQTMTPKVKSDHA